MGVVVVIFYFQMVPDQLCAILNLVIHVALNMVIVVVLMNTANFQGLISEIFQVR